MGLSKEINLIGIDLGGTKVNIGLVKGENIIKKNFKYLPKNSNDEWDIINLIIGLIDVMLTKNKVTAIGIGVPSILDRERGIIHEVQNIPSWKEVPLADILTNKFGIPVFLDNDANCFALGEHQFGLGKSFKNMVGVTLGTGMGSGIITNGHLMSDANGGAGEFGMIPYKDGIMEDYCSGKFFKTFYNSNGEKLMQLANEGNKEAIEAFSQFGQNLGTAINTIMYAVDPEKIIIGGSIIQSAKYFDASLRESIQKFSFNKTLENFDILYSENPDIAVLGAASLYYDRIQTLN